MTENELSSSIRMLFRDSVLKNQIVKFSKTVKDETTVFETKFAPIRNSHIASL
jgi:hypothetical protein